MLTVGHGCPGRLQKLRPERLQPRLQELSAEQRRRAALAAANRARLDRERLTALVANRDRHAVARLARHEVRRLAALQERQRPALLATVLAARLGGWLGAVASLRAERDLDRAKDAAIAKIAGHYVAHKLRGKLLRDGRGRLIAVTLLQRAYRRRLLYRRFANRIAAADKVFNYLFSNCREGVFQGLVKRYRYSIITVQRMWRAKKEREAAQIWSAIRPRPDLHHHSPATQGSLC